MRVGKHTKCFFDKNHFNTLDSKLTMSEYRLFIRKIHLEIDKEVILGTKEGFIMPLKLGDIRVVKEKKNEGVITTHTALTKDGKKEYNRHSFGYIYSFFWDKKQRAEYYNKNRRSLVPRYKNKPIMWFTIFKFTPTREFLKRDLAKKIFNQDFIF